MYIKFGEPESVVGGSFFDYVECPITNGFYMPQIPNMGLMQSFRANPVHSSAIYAKRNLVSLSIETNNMISRTDLNNFILDRFIFGNGYLLAVKNPFGKIIKYKHLPAMYMRKSIEPDKYVWYTYNQRIDYPAGAVFHSKEYDPGQEIYGIPEYLSVISSVLLNEEATLFRRRYYKNGMHAGFLLYMNNPNLTAEQEKEIARKLNSGKGLGNFKNLFINGKGKDKEKPELIPVGEITAKDEFLNMKQATRADILTAHRIPVPLMSIIQDGPGSVGDLSKIDQIFYKNEIIPIVRQIEDLNNHAGEKVISLISYQSLV